MTTFECDSDCIEFLKDNGLKYADAGETHVVRYSCMGKPEKQGTRGGS